MELKELAKKNEASKALFQYIGNRRRDTHHLDTQRLYRFFKQDDPSMRYEDLLSTTEELVRMGYGKLDKGVFLLNNDKSIYDLSITPRIKEKRTKRRKKQMIARRPKQEATTPPVIVSAKKARGFVLHCDMGEIGNITVELPANTSPQKMFEIIQQVVKSG